MNEMLIKYNGGGGNTPINKEVMAFDREKGGLKC